MLHQGEPLKRVALVRYMIEEEMRLAPKDPMDPLLLLGPGVAVDRVFLEIARD